MARGIEALGAELKRYQMETLKEVKEMVAYSASDLLNKAQHDLDLAISKYTDTRKFSNISLSMKVGEDSKGFSMLVGDPAVGSSKDSHMAAYLEFGTGLNFHIVMADNNYPQEIKDLAAQFKQTCNGTLKGSPFLFNNYYKVRDNFVKELNSYLKTRHK